MVCSVLRMVIFLGYDDQFLAESDRQALLVRLMREKRQAEKEGNFEKAALLMGLLERQQADGKIRLINKLKSPIKFHLMEFIHIWTYIYYM